MVTIYILECKRGKYYVGKIKTNVWKRIKAHFDGKGAKWTKKYKPVDVVDIRRDLNNYHETLVTLEMMREHGIDNVRGGVLSRVHLKKEHREYAEYRLGMRKERPNVDAAFNPITSTFRGVILPLNTVPLNKCRAMKKNGRGRCLKAPTEDDQLCDMHRRSANKKKSPWKTITKEQMENPDLLPKQKPYKPRNKRRRKRRIPYRKKTEEPAYRKLPMPTLRDWGDDTEPWLDEERVACLEGIHQGWMDVDNYALELFSEWPEAWKQRWLYLEKW